MSLVFQLWFLLKIDMLTTKRPLKRANKVFKSFLAGFIYEQIVSEYSNLATKQQVIDWT